MSARWLLDTSAYARRHIPAVARALSARIEAGEELLLSQPVLLELLRGPRGEDVRTERARLEGAFAAVAMSEHTADLAADAMVALAATAPDAHRVPLADLLTAASAHEHGAGVLHLDAHFERLAAASGLEFSQASVCTPEELADVEGQSPAIRQRELRRALNAALARLPIDEAERLLTDFIARAEGAAGA